jgi:catalase
MAANRNRMAVAEGELAERLPAQLVQDFHAAFGEHHARAVHTKGFILQGTYTPSAEARELCRAQLFMESSVPVVVRFSDFTGLPNIPDTQATANPRGLAIKFLMPDGSDTDIVSHSFNGFRVSTSSDFHALLQAIAHSGGEPTPGSELETFLGSHPTAKTFLITQTQLPQSWAATSFYSVNAVQFTDAQGRNRFVRYQFIPEAGEHSLAPRRGGDEVRRLPVGGTRRAGRRQSRAVHLGTPRSPRTPTSSTIPPRPGRTTGNASRSVTS